MICLHWWYIPMIASFVFLGGEIALTIYSNWRWQRFWRRGR